MAVHLHVVDVRPATAFRRQRMLIYNNNHFGVFDVFGLSQRLQHIKFIDDLFLPLLPQIDDDR